ncbi:MAG TPA: NHLP family bacteriocin export ABC transporter peptidase/permease/ATPase subunit [Azospirillum sp.]|nr:NHLP family bacteriocin export ABC transporter peptidase/permease/ATPase subunit [Azospirillum sp.]
MIGRSPFGPLFGGRRVRTPTVLQMEASECGAASLAIVLGHFGRFVPLEELRVACGVSRDGSRLDNVMRAAQAYGLVPQALRVEPADLAKLPLPLVVFWEFNHFLVVEGVGRDRVRLNDPATGPRSVSRAAFDRAFTGIALVLTRGPEFRREGTPPRPLAGLAARLRSSRSAVVFAVLASLMLVVPGLLLPTFSRVFTDYVLIGEQAGWLKPLLQAMGGAALLTFLLMWLRQAALLRFETTLSMVGAGRFLMHVLHLPMAFFAQRHGSEVAARVALNDRLAVLLSHQLATAALNLLTVAVFALVMAQYDVVLTGVVVGFAALNLLALALTTRALADRGERAIAETGKLSGMAMQGLTTIETYKAGGTESVLFTRLTAANARLLNIRQDMQRAQARLGMLPSLLASVAGAAVLVAGGLRIMEGEITVGMLAAFQGLMGLFLGPVGAFVQVAGQIQDARGLLARTDDVLRQPPDPAFADDVRSRSRLAQPTASTRKLAGHVSLHDVTFGYSPLEPPLIQGLSLDLPAGAHVAVVGASGSGKSTIAKLVSGLYRPWSGEVRIDGRPIDAIPLPELRNSVAVVDQEIVLFSGSVRDNLALWDGAVPEERLHAAARDAAIHDFIASRADGYEAVLYEKGRNLSGGQRARLELARALALDPGVLILDEATSALDPIAEAEVTANLRRRGCTCIIVAHRLSTIRDADLIVVIDQGRVVQQGRHDDLKDADGPYRRLLDA